MFVLPGIGPVGGSAIKSIQSGTLTTASTSTAVTISRVNIAKSVVIVLSAPSSIGQITKGRLTDDVTLTLVTVTTGGGVDWQVVEFN